MKHKLSITLEQETLLKMNDRIRDSIFRNKSHLAEFAIKKLLEDYK